MVRLTKESLYELLKSRFPEGFLKLRELPDPKEFKDLQKAARRIADAIRRGEKIAIIGDYDVDGVVSSVLMQEFFDAVGHRVTIEIPNRFRDGYGINSKIVDRIEADLIITVDNGIGAHDAAQRCRERGIDLIITDHHTPPEILPEAYAIVNPKQQGCSFPYSEICGAQVAWFLTAQLKRELSLNFDLKRSLDLVALAIVADVMPLRHINRSLVQAGLQMVERSHRPAIRFLRDSLKKNRIGSDDLAFGIAPIINSAGRMEDARIAFDFLLSKDLFEASIYYSRLLALNAERRAEERRVLEEARRSVGEERVIVAVGDDWNEGVVGIVAARLAEEYGRPAIVLTKSREGYLKGSGRSPDGVDLYALLHGTKDLLIGFGGHKKAAGVSLDPLHLETFRKELEGLAANLHGECGGEDPHILGELPFQEVDWELIDILQQFAPYGEGNPLPKFLAREVEVLEWREVGEKGEHLLLTLRQNGVVFKGIFFRSTYHQRPPKVDIVYHPARNEFNNSVNIQLFISEIR
ncbi:MAG: single-stranded-DNA-specific exonuclease RecJ [Epsilonproteobacteria bacterium]|nr:single-stranded-DNA-specific exonuclease RecJ [Campylobacterota bacterium]NPA57629.1 single-stranded-DNA-specific exonuclease RecJ [Campylobacterota bacterium]